MKEINEQKAAAKWDPWAIDGTELYTNKISAEKAAYYQRLAAEKESQINAIAATLDIPLFGTTDEIFILFTSEDSFDYSAANLAEIAKYEREIYISEFILAELTIKNGAAANKLYTKFNDENPSYALEEFLSEQPFGDLTYRFYTPPNPTPQSILDAVQSQLPKIVAEIIYNLQGGAENGIL